MTELEKEIMRVLDLHELGKSIYAKPGDDGISRADFVRSEPQRMGATGMDLQPPIRSPLQQAEPQTLEKTRQDLPAVAAGVTTGPLVGTAEAADLALGLVKGAYKSINPSADETRMGAFLSGITEQFESGYGEAARSMLLDMGRKAGYSQDQIDTMDEAITAGSLFGIGGAVKQAPKVISKGLDAVETLGDRATQQLAEGGTRLMAGAPIDDAVNKGFAAAGDAVAKFRAPTEKEPGIIAFHGSGADFDEFKLEKIGTGEGAQAYGYGLYFTDSEDIARFYRDTISRRQGGIPQSVPDNPENVAENLALDINFNEGIFGDTKQLQINSASPDYDFYIQTLDDNAVETTQSGALKTFEFSDGSIISLLDETVPVFNGKALDSVYTSDVQDVFSAEIADIAQRAKDMGVPGTLEELTDDVTTVLSQLGQGLSSKRDMSMAVESLAPSGQGAPSRFKTIYNHFIEPKSTIETTSTVTELGSKKGKMYKVGLEPKPEDMLDYQGTFADQPKKVQDALKAIGYEVETNKVGQRNSKAEVDVAMKRPMPVVLDMVKNKIAEDASGKINEVDINKMSEFIAKGGDRILSERLLEQGVPGIKYRAAGSRAASVDAADAEMNYVIFDDKMIKILEKYGIVGPVAITGIAASQQEGESDGQSS